MSRALKNIAVFGIITSYNSLFQERVLDVASTNGIAKPPTASLKILNKKFMDMSNVLGSGLDLLDAYAYFGINNPAFDPFTLICWKRGVLFTANGGITPHLYGWKNNMLNGYLNPQTDLYSDINRKYAKDSAIKFATIYEESGSSTPSHNLIDGRDVSLTDNVWYAADIAAQRINNGSNNLNANADLSGTGFKAIVRTSSNDVRLENKDVVINRTSASTGFNIYPVFIGRRASGGSSNTSGLGYTEWGAGAALTNTQTQALRATTNQALSDFGLTPIA